MKTRKLKKSFTLIEVLMAVTIMVVVAMMMAVVGRGMQESAKKRKTQAMIAAMEVGAARYQADTGQYPDDTNGIESLMESLLSDPWGGYGYGWSGMYIGFDRKDYQNDDPSTNILVDPWDKPFNYEVAPASGNTSSFNLWSNGPDREDDSGADDDITNW